MRLDVPLIVPIERAASIAIRKEQKAAIVMIHKSKTPVFHVLILALQFTTIC